MGDEIGRMVVVARVRPFNERERTQRRAVSVDEQDGTLKLQFGTRPEMAYRFDSIFNEASTQEQIFMPIEPLVDGTLEGYNCSIFTYGQTGTGKTHTILGHDLWALAAECDAVSSVVEAGIRDTSVDGGKRGLIPRTMQHLFQRVQRRKENEKRYSWVMTITYLEIYNERVRDLLSPPDNPEDNSSLDIREDPERGLYVPGATEVSVSSLDQVLDILWSGARNRAMSATDMNAHSSRSHTILTIFLDQKWQSEGRRLRSKCSLIDLAGSEKWRSHQLTKFSANRIKELTSINQSLSTLSNCISALLRAERSRRSNPGATTSPRQHIPYRDSKLTRLLQDSLGGNTKTAFIVTLSPAAASGEETLSTLQFATRAMRVQTFATANANTLDGNAITRYQNEIARLKALLRAATSDKAQPHDPKAGRFEALEERVSGEMAADLEKLQDENLNLLQEISHLRTELESERREKQMILETIYGVDAVQSGSSNATSESPKSSTAPSRMDPTLQLKTLQIQKNALAERLEDLEHNERLQEDRWQWLEQYHTWLRSLPFETGDSATQSASKGSVTLHDRLSMMETSVVMQSQELKRTKELFLRHNGKLQNKLDELSTRHSALLRMKTSGGVPKGLGGISSLQQQSTPCRLPRRLSTEHVENSVARKEEGSVESNLRFDLDQELPQPEFAMKDKVVTSSRSDISGVQETPGNIPSESLADVGERRVGNESSTTKQQDRWTGYQSTESTEKTKSKSKGKRVKFEWSEHKDPQTGLMYYHNRLSKVTTWEKPQNFPGAQL